MVELKSRFDLNIDYPVERMRANRERMEARTAFRYTDRVPVGFCLAPRYFTPVFDIPYGAIFENAEEQYYWLIQFLKYRIENIPEDMICTGTTLSVAPYFDNVLDSSAFGAEIVWPENETLQSRPTIHTMEQMERYVIPAIGSGLWGRTRDWWQQMREYARNTKVTFNGVDGRVNIGHLGVGGLSPHMIAVDLVGHDFYWWQVEYPKQCHAFLTKITEGLTCAQRHFMTIDDRPRASFGMAEDCAQVMSSQMFRDFCVPYTGRLFDTFGAGIQDGRGLHMCGQSSHLHQSMLDNLRVSSFNLFGHPVDPMEAAENLGGRMYLWGNIDPLLLLRGTKAQVMQASRTALEALAPGGGFMLGDGANVCPGTPLANLAALTEACVEFGLPAGQERHLL